VVCKIWKNGEMVSLGKIGRGDKVCLGHDLCVRGNEYRKFSNKSVEFLNQSGYIATFDVV